MNKEKYDRYEVIQKLQRKGLKPKPNAHNIEYFEKSPYNHVGIKVLGMVDFLGAKVRNWEQKPKNPNKPKKFKRKYMGYKKCCRCSHEATIHRFYEGEESYLCDNVKCDREWRDTNGLTVLVKVA